MAPNTVRHAHVVLRKALADVDRFVQALEFNWLIAGIDAHAKNYGLVLSGTNARLAPLYDVASALVMPEWNWHKWELPMRIDKQGKIKYPGIEDWKKFATSANVDLGVIETAIAEHSPALLDAAVADAARPRWTSTSTSERSPLTDRQGLPGALTDRHAQRSQQGAKELPQTS